MCYYVKKLNVWRQKSKVAHWRFLNLFIWQTISREYFFPKYCHLKIHVGWNFSTSLNWIYGVRLCCKSPEKEISEWEKTLKYFGQFRKIKIYMHKKCIWTKTGVFRFTFFFEKKFHTKKFLPCNFFFLYGKTKRCFILRFLVFLKIFT